MLSRQKIAKNSFADE